MRRFTAVGLGALVAAAAVAAVALGYGIGGGSRPVGPDAPKALAVSAHAFQQQVQSLQSDFTFDASIAGANVSGKGRMAYQSPDRAYLTLSMNGGDVAGIDIARMLGSAEFLIAGDRVYVKAGPLGWMSASLESLGLDPAKVRELLSGHSPIDYQKVVQNAGGTVVVVGTEQLNGATVQHYRLTADAGALVKSLADALAERNGPLGRGEKALAGISGPATVDVWVDQQTMLPAKLTAEVQVSPGGQKGSLDLTMNFNDYNQPAGIPDTPADATQLDKLIGWFLGGH